MKNFESLMIIPNVFSENHHISSNTYNGQLFGGAYTFFCHPHPLNLIEETKDYPQCHNSGCTCKEVIYQCDSVISICTIILYRKKKCGFNFHFILDFVHRISSSLISSSGNAILVFVLQNDMGYVT